MSSLIRLGLAVGAVTDVFGARHPEIVSVGAPVKERMPWYQTGDEIREQLQQLAGNCGEAEASFSTRSKVATGSAAGQQVDIDVFTVRGKMSQDSAANLKPKVKAMFVYGEHARELISPESALYFAKTLCGHGGSSALASTVLQNVEFTLVPNANPLGRKEVENGNYCKRTNEDGTDLNRNWGSAHRDETLANSDDEMNPGPYGFSAPETQLLKDLLDEVHPDIYLSVHSGAYLLGTPFGYTLDKTPKDLSEMEDVLKPISSTYCGGNCPYGDLAQLIHYKNFGCDIDYVYETLGTPYVFTWEIYTGERFRQGYIEQAHDKDGSDVGDLGLLQKSKNGGGLRGRMQTGEKMGENSPEKGQNIEDCIDQFVPRTEEETKSVVENWAGAYLELCEEVVKKKNGAASTTNAPASADGVSDGAAQGATDGDAPAQSGASPPALLRKDSVMSPGSWERAMMRELGS